MDKQSKQLYSTTFTVALALVCFLLVLAISHDNQHTWDMTANKRFTFSEQTEQVVKGLEAPVKLYAFLDPTGDTSSIEDILGRYKALNAGDFSFEIVDKDKRPTLAASMQVRNHGQGVLELVGSELTSKDQLPRRERVTSFDEPGITNSLLKLNRTGTKKVYFRVTSDQDLGPKKGLGGLAKALALEGFESYTVNLVETETLPPNADLIVIAGPATPLGDKERELLDSYIQAGGKLLFLAGEATGSTYTEWLRGYGYDVQAKLIIDRGSQLLNTSDLTFAAGFTNASNHPIAIASKVETGFQMSRPVELLEAQALEGGGAPKLEVISRTLASAVASDYDPDDLSGLEQKVDVTLDEANDSIPLAVAGLYPRGSATQPDASPSPSPTPRDEESLTSARIVVIGNTRAFLDGYFEKYGNRDFILNCINWLAESENQITVRVKDHRNQPLMLQQNQFNWLLFLFCVLVPVLSALTGVMVAYQRRKGMTE